jgi:hypothetical protein
LVLTNVKDIVEEVGELFKEVEDEADEVDNIGWAVWLLE